MNAVWKFELLSGQITVPMGARLLSIQVQRKAICAWFLVDPNEKRKTVLDYEIVGTGQEFELKGRHLATFQDGPFVWHVFGTKEWGL